MAEVTLGNLYELNKQAMLLEPVLDMVEKNDALEKIITEMIEQENVRAWMCLNHERRDFTIFLNCYKDKKLRGQMKQDLREFIDNRGDLISIDKQDNGAYEIWIKDNAECFCYIFFDYSNAIIEY
jgi:hypothetical protein